MNTIIVLRRLASLLLAEDLAASMAGLVAGSGGSGQRPRTSGAGPVVVGPSGCAAQYRRLAGRRRTGSGRLRSGVHLTFFPCYSSEGGDAHGTLTGVSVLPSNSISRSMKSPDRRARIRPGRSSATPPELARPPARSQEARLRESEEWMQPFRLGNAINRRGRTPRPIRPEGSSSRRGHCPTGS